MMSMKRVIKKEIIRNAAFLQDQVCEELDNITNKLVELYQVKLTEITLSQSSSGRPISLQPPMGTSRESSILTAAVKSQLKDEYSIMEDEFASLSLDTTKIQSKLQDTLCKDLQETISGKCPLLNDLLATLLGSGITAGYLERRERKDLSVRLKRAVQALACLVYLRTKKQKVKCLTFLDLLQCHMELVNSSLLC